MNKNKLKLHRATLRRLADARLTVVVGGISGDRECNYSIPANHCYSVECAESHIGHGCVSNDSMC